MNSPKDVDPDRGARIRDRRQEKGWSIPGVKARPTPRGKPPIRDLPDSSIEAWERGEVPGRHLPALAHALQVHEHWLETGDESQATRIRMRRLEKGMTQAELGRATRGDASARAEGAVQFWERPSWWTPNRTLEAQSRVALARVLDKPQRWLLMTEEAGPPADGDRPAYLETRVTEIGETVAQLAERRSRERRMNVADEVVNRLRGGDDDVTLRSLREDVQSLTRAVLLVRDQLEMLGAPAAEAPGSGSSGELVE